MADSNSKGRLPPGRWLGLGAPLFSLISAFAFLAGCPACQEESLDEESMPEEPPAPAVPYDGRLRLVALQVDGGGMPLNAMPYAPIELPEGGSIYVETWQRLHDFRVRLTDASDRLVPFTLETGPVVLREPGSTEAGGTWFRLTPAAPLVAGRDYVLRVEPEIGERVTDYAGLSYEDLYLEVRLATVDPEIDDDEIIAVDAPDYDPERVE